MDVNHQEINTSVEVEKKKTTHKKAGSSRHHSHQHHRGGFFRRLKRNLFRKNNRISRVKHGRVMAERRLMQTLFIGAVILLLLLIPLIAWLGDIVNTSSVHSY